MLGLQIQGLSVGVKGLFVEVAGSVLGLGLSVGLQISELGLQVQWISMFGCRYRSCSLFKDEGTAGLQAALVGVPWVHRERYLQPGLKVALMGAPGVQVALIASIRIASSAHRQHQDCR